MTRTTPTLLIIHGLGRSTQGVTHSLAPCPSPCPFPLATLRVCNTSGYLAAVAVGNLCIFSSNHKLRRKRDSCVERTPTARLEQRHLPSLLLLLAAAAACHTKIAQSSASINNNNAADGAGETGKETDPRLETGDSRKQIQIPLPRSAARAAQPIAIHFMWHRPHVLRMLPQATNSDSRSCCAVTCSCSSPLSHCRCLSIKNKAKWGETSASCKLQVAVARGKVKEIAVNSGNIS